MSFNFGNFDITSGLSSLTDQFQQVASTIESTLRDDRFGIAASNPASATGTPKAAGGRCIHVHVNTSGNTLLPSRD